VRLRLSTVEPIVTRQFNGFLVQTEPAVGIPRAFFTDVLPQISELNEVQATLAVFRLASEAGGIESPVSEAALRADRALRTALHPAPLRRRAR
jgi:hypothetical protein